MLQEIALAKNKTMVAQRVLEERSKEAIDMKQQLMDYSQCALRNMELFEFNKLCENCLYEHRRPKNKQPLWLLVIGLPQGVDCLQGRKVEMIK